MFTVQHSLTPIKNQSRLMSIPQILSNQRTSSASGRVSLFPLCLARVLPHVGPEAGN
jgi:hypothetical protein